MFSHLSLSQQGGTHRRYPAAQSPKIRFWVFFLILTWGLRPVLGTLLPSVSNACRIKNTTYDVVSHRWQIPYAATSNQYDRVFL
jgi:hypothetical protein